jgi:hypothetical protein
VQSSANVTKWTFHDGTVLDVKQEEHSVRQIISFTRSAVRWRSISDQSLNSRLLFPPLLQPPRPADRLWAFANAAAERTSTTSSPTRSSAPSRRSATRASSPRSGCTPSRPAPAPAAHMWSGPATSPATRLQVRCPTPADQR